MEKKKKLNPKGGDTLSLAGILHLHLYNKKNELLWKTKEGNLIVTLGYHTVAKALAGVQNSHISQIAIGANGAPPEESDLRITDSLLFDVKRITYPKPGIVRFHFEIGYGEAIGVSIREFGLITAGNKLFSRKVREVIEKTEDFRIAGYWDIVICDNISESEYFLTLEGENDFEVSFDAGGGSQVFSLNSSHPWTALPENQGFVSVDPASGPAGSDQLITITVDANAGDGRSEIVAFDNEIGQYAQANVHQAAAEKYTLTIDRQNDSQPDMSEHYAGASITVPAAPYKSGFDFTGYRWSANNALVQPGVQLTMPSVNASLIAEYIVTPPPQPAYIHIDGETNLTDYVNAGGGSQVFQLNSSSPWEVVDPFAFGSLSSESGNAGDGQNITVVISANTGSARSDTVVFANEEGEYCQLNIVQAEVVAPTVYWNVAKSGTFTRNNCGGGYSGTAVTYTVPAHTYSSTVSQADANAQAQADVNANGQAYANQNGSCTLNPPDTHPLTYDLNGGTIANYNGGTPPGNYAEHTYIGLPVTEPVKEGYTFDGWEDDALNQRWYPGYEYTPAMPAQQLSFTAVWYQIKYWNVEKSGTFTRNNCGNGSSGTDVTYTVPASTYSSTVSQADADAQAQADVNANGQAYANQNGSCIVDYVAPSLGNLEVLGYAGHYAGEGVNLSVQWDVENGENILASLGPGNKYSVTLRPPGATELEECTILFTDNNGCILAGVYLMAGQYQVGVRAYGAQGEDLSLTSSFTISNPTPPDTYPLTYDLNGGTIANYNGGTAPGYYAAGFQIVAPTTVPVKGGWIFAGWYSSVTSQILGPGDVDNAGMMQGGVTLTAQWEAEKETYPLTYELDGGTIANYNGGTAPGNYVSGYQIVAPMTIPVKSDWTFAGWYNAITGQILGPGDVDNAGMMQGGVTLTAQWEVQPPAIDDGNPNEDVPNEDEEAEEPGDGGDEEAV
ncbi:MAG: DUF5977 domain-containing protein [Dysgonamonadaceae bacterium]|nr:DUF5977 domain-containing protein [Dysgonamonadaceae bacterium]